MPLSTRRLRPAGNIVRHAILAGCLLGATAVSALYVANGSVPELPALFVIPVVAAAWLLGMKLGFGVAFAVVLLWSVADWLLAAEQARPPLAALDATTRLTCLSLLVWLLHGLKRTVRRALAQTRRDPLTTLFNCQGLTAMGRQALRVALRARSPFAAILIDVDDFKAINDRLGHATGDRLLRSVAQVIATQRTATDIAGRVEGDAFALLMPDTDRHAARRRAENLKSLLHAEMQHHGWDVTFSIGIACSARASATLGELLRSADEMTYLVKYSGKNGLMERSLTSPATAPVDTRLKPRQTEPATCASPSRAYNTTL